MGRFSWSNWRRTYRLLREQGQAGAQREAGARAALALLAEAGWRLDRRAAPPPRTVLVVGHQRSGTTLLHRLMAAHPEASALPLHGLLLPADFWQRLFARCPRPAFWGRIQTRLFGPLDSLHRIRFEEPEEDEFLLWALFRSPMNGLDRPWPGTGPPDLEEDDGALAFYAEALGKSVRRTRRRHVGKNPHFTHRIPALRRALPGVRLVQLVRHPRQAIASRLSLIEAIWRRRFAGFGGLSREQVEHVYRNSLRCYLSGLGQADLDVPFEELQRDPLAVVERVHRTFDLEPLDDATRALAAAHAGRAARAVPLEAFGLDRERLARDLAPVYARWGLNP